MAKHNYVTVTSNKKKWTAFFWCIVGGYLGLHYVYVGRYGKAILYCCTLGLCFFGWWHDLGLILKGKFQDNVGDYLRA